MNRRIRYIVGPPGSGKSTYVRTHKSPADLVLDFDAIAVAIGSPSRDHHREPHPPPHRAIARALWPTIHRQLLSAADRGVGVWIIHAVPSLEAIIVYRERGVIVELPQRIGPRLDP